MLEQKLGLKAKSTKDCCTRIASALCLLGVLGFAAMAEMHPLPSGYTQLEWIAATGTQLIDTRYYHNADTIISCDVWVSPTEQVNSFSALFGTRAGGWGKSNSALGFFVRWSGTVKPTFEYGVADTAYLAVGGVDAFALGERTTVTVDGRTATWTSATKSGSVTSTSAPCNGESPILIFDTNADIGDSAVPVGNPATMRLYAFTIREGETLVRDFVPCRNARGEAGLWDKVEGRFHGNVGTGLIFGSDLPARRLNFISGNGPQYVDTEYVHTADTRIECDVNVSSQQSGNYACVFGARGTGWNGATAALGFFTRWQGNYLPFIEYCSAKGNGPKGGTGDFPYNTDVRISFAGKTFSWMKDGIEKSLTSTEATSIGCNSLFIFDFNGGLNGEKAKGGNPATMKLYAFRISEGTTLLHEFVPARAADGRTGVVDLMDANPETAFRPNLGAPAFAYDYAYKPTEDGVTIFDGTVTAAHALADVAVAKSGPDLLTVSAPAFASFALQQGAVRFTGETTLAGTFSLAGGTRLCLDVSASGNSKVTAAATDLSTASAGNPVIIELRPENADTFRTRSTFTLLEGGLTSGDEAKFSVTDLPVRLEVVEGSLVATVLASVPFTAEWTGRGNRAQVNNPANWDCRNYAGELLSDVCPTNVTSVRLGATTDFNCPAGQTLLYGEFVFPDEVTLTADCDWRGLDAPLAGTVNLNGHKLRMARLVGRGTVTDTSDPNAYQRLEFIESTGGAYINTGYQVTRTTRIVAHFYTGTRTGSWTQFFGAGDSKNNQNTAVLFRYWGTENRLNAFFCNASGGDATVDGDWSNTDLQLALSINGLTLNGTQYPMTKTDYDPYPVDLYIFCGDVNGKSGNAQNCRLYSFKIYEGETLVHDYVPVLRTSDTVLGLLDVVNGGAEFKQNVGAGQFVAGPVVSEGAPMGGGELRVTVEAGKAYENASVTLAGGFTFVKDGAGTLLWGGGANSVAVTVPVVVTNGVFRFSTDADNVFGVGGDIRISGKGQMDIAKKTANGRGAYSPVFNRTFYIEGNGPDGTGAIVRNAISDETGYHLRTVNLTGDATLGGASRIDFNGNASRLNGAEHVLTIKNTGCVAFYGGDSGLSVGRLVLTDGGKYQPCNSATGPFDISDCIELRNGGQLSPWANSATATMTIGAPVVVGEGGGVIPADQGYAAFTNRITVLPGATLNVLKTVTVADVELRAGATLDSSGAVAITGTLSGDGAITGGNVTFLGPGARWLLTADGDGFTSKVSVGETAAATFWPGTKRFEVVYNGDTTAGCRIFDLAPGGGVSPVTIFSDIALDVRDSTTAPIVNCGIEVTEEGRLALHIGDAGIVRTAVWRGGATGALDEPSNWLCSNDVAAVEEKLPQTMTRLILPEGCIFNCPSGASLLYGKVEFPTKLVGDCNWCGLDAPIDGTVDLCGHKLYVSKLKGSGTVTDTSNTNGYQRLEFIDSDGTAYINTGYKAKRTTRIAAHLFSCTRTGNWTQFFGAGDTKNNQNTAVLFRYWATENRLNAFFCNASGGDATVEGDWADTDLQIELSIEGLKLNGTLYPMTPTSNDPYPTDLCIFCGNSAGKVGNAQTCRLYSFKIYEGETLVHDFAPARRTSDGALGLLDVVNGGAVFKPNAASSGKFIAGPVVAADEFVTTGELHLDVAEGQTETGGSIKIAGTVKLVKEGSGTYSPASDNQLYLGGLSILGGTVHAGGWGDKYRLGAPGNAITVGEGGTLDMDGTREHYEYAFTLAGGEWVNTTPLAENRNSCQATTVRMTEDSTIDFNNWAVSGYCCRPTTLDLGGKTLTMNTQGSCYFMRTTATRGTLEIHGSIEFGKGDFYGPETTLDMDGELKLDGVNCHVGTYIARATTTDASYNGDLFVYEKFKPITDNFWGCVMKSGSTIDLSERTGEWHVKGNLVSSGTTGFTKTTVTFEDGAMVFIDLGNRRFVQKERVVAWDDATKPTNFGTLTFKPASGQKVSLVKKDDGIYVFSGFTIFLR